MWPFCNQGEQKSPVLKPMASRWIIPQTDKNNKNLLGFVLYSELTGLVVWVSQDVSRAFWSLYQGIYDDEIVTLTPSTTVREKRIELSFLFLVDVGTLANHIYVVPSL